MNDWQQDIRHAIKDKSSLEEYFNCIFPETDQPIFIPLRLAAKIKQHGMNSPLAKQFLPQKEENKTSGFVDPIGDFKPGPLPYFIHRYDNRALFFPTTVCPVQCRYCFRKNSLHNDEINLNASFEAIGKYLKDHPEINEIIFSGGDPLMLNEKKLHTCCDFLSKFEHIKYLRFHTRMPMIVPSRINAEFITFLNALKERWNLTLVIHTNHIDEFDQEVEQALIKLSNFHLLSQSVLLRGINDNVIELKNLFEKLLQLNIRPYYLHHPDQVKGGMHFHISQENGQEIFQGLRKQMSGWMLPQYVIDSPSAAGKIQISSQEKIYLNLN